ncbi:MAG: hypothetical protein KAG66_04360, partial [Methylococcales bacterium]|nr:hypothetical protein [Methylococcales bacterium]
VSMVAALADALRTGKQCAVIAWAVEFAGFGLNLNPACAKQACRTLRGESPRRERPNQPPVPSVAVSEEY